MSFLDPGRYSGRMPRNLEAIPREDQTRREFVEWQIRFAEKRMADVCARLATMGGEE